MRWWIGVVVGVFSVVLTACTSVPIQEMSDARQAISAAREAGAEIYAKSALSAAEQWLDSAKISLAEGEYDRSREAAVAAKEEAVRARSEALEKQESTE